MAKSMHNINLLPNRGDTLLMQFLNWALTIGRLLVILVETLALGTFLYRFSLDMQIQDLKEKIKDERAIVTGFKSEEDKFRDLQAKLDLIKKIGDVSENNPKMLSDVIEMGKGYVTFRNVSISTKVIQIEAQASSVAPLRAFIESLKKYPPVASVSIDKVENKTSSVAIIVSININLKQNDQSAIFEEDQLQTTVPFDDKKPGN